MDVNQLNTTTKISNMYLSPTIIWCLLMPLIHFLSLISNILCIIVFCSKTFIHKPIAIYFICLLISDSTTLLIGYTEMLDRETSMIDKSSTLCMFNGKIIHNLADFIYTFMGKYCLEWMLYKVLWTRASTILLAILSIQRSRTFFSLSYHETRLCALFACMSSILLALLITCFEWIGVQCEQPVDTNIYMEIYQSISIKNSSKEFYLNFLTDHYDEKYSCMIQSFNNTILDRDQSNCTTTKITTEFHSLTQSLLNNRDPNISETITDILYNVYDNTTVHLIEYIRQAKSSDIIIKLFEKRPCHITLIYSYYLKFYNFLHSISFGFNRHTLAIFFGNALPSFVVFSANLLSIKVIYFSKNLKYLKYTKRKNHRHRRLQNDVRAFLVILIESFSVITISWGIPIFLTMFHCHTLYVLSMSVCPAIKKSLAFFLFTDLFNSSTNCLLYSLSGKLFRRKFISIIKMLFTCGRINSWNNKNDLTRLPSQQIELQQSIDISANVNYGAYTGNGSYKHSQIFTTKQIKTLQNGSKSKRSSDDNASLSLVKLSDDNEPELDLVKQMGIREKFTKPRTIKTFLITRVQFCGSTKTVSRIKRINQKPEQQQTRKHLSSTSSSSGAGTSIRNHCHRQLINNQSCSSKIVLVNSDDDRSLTKENPFGNVTTL